MHLLTPPHPHSVFKRGQEWKYLHRRIPISEVDISGSVFFVRALCLRCDHAARMLLTDMPLRPVVFVSTPTKPKN